MWPLVVGIKELCDIAIVVLSSGKPVQMIIIVANVEAAALGSPHQHSLRVVMETLLPRVLNYHPSAVVFVLPLSKLHNPVHHVVFHRNGVTSENLSQHVKPWKNQEQIHITYTY